MGGRIANPCKRDVWVPPKSPFPFTLEKGRFPSKLLIVFKGTQGKCRAHLKGGQRKGWYSHLLATTLSLRAAGPATVLSHKCGSTPLVVERRPNCAQQLLASTLSAPRVAATLYCDPGRYANVVTPCLLTCPKIRFSD